MLAGSHYRILKDDAVHPYTDLAPSAMTRVPLSFLGVFGGCSPRFPKHGGCYPGLR
jgi:hypothetical protein